MWEKIGIEIKGIKAISITASLLIVILFGYFYWYEWRPSQIIKEYNKETLELSKETEGITPEVHEFYYKTCLRKMGLELKK